MPNNEYSYIGGSDLDGRMYTFASLMEKYDLNSTAIHKTMMKVALGPLEIVTYKRGIR